jgi:hypothetical protein
MERTRVTARLLSLVAAVAVFAGVANAEPSSVPAAASKSPVVYIPPTRLTSDRSTPRTRDGHPDLQGAVWEMNFFAPLEALPKGPADLILPEAEAKKAHDAFLNPIMNAPFLALDPEAPALMAASRGFPLVRGQRHSRMVAWPADGKIPFTPQARQDIDAPGRGRKADNPEDRNTLERCIGMGAVPPVILINATNPWEFFQTREHIVMHSESGDEVRIIPFAKVHGPAAAAPPMGDSIAHWEGDTLVVETVDFLRRERFRGTLSGSLIVNPEAKVTERFTRLSRDELLYQFTVEDPKVYAAPWLGEYSLYRVSYRMFPSACHEGNYGLPNILAGAREEERAAAAAKAAVATPPS